MEMNKSDKHDENEDNYFTIVPEAGLCLVGDVILNLRKVTLLRKQDDHTLVYYSGVKDPIQLPADVFDEVREAAFSMDNLDFDDEDYPYDDDDEEDDEEFYDDEEDEDEDEEDEDDEDDEPPAKKRRK